MGGCHISALESEEILPFALELNGIVKLGDCLGAFYVEPQDTVQVAAVGVYVVPEGLLHEAVHVVLLQGIALVVSLQRWLVEDVHF